MWHIHFKENLGQRIHLLTISYCGVIIGKMYEYPISSDNTISVGFPYLDVKKKSYSKTKREKNILFISQGLVGKALAKYAATLSNDSDIDYRILFKLHPFEQAGWKTDYPELLTSNVTVIDDQKTKLHDLLAESEIQVGVCSTALYEGLAFGLQTYLVEEPCIEIMTPLLETGLATKVTSSKELIKYIKENKKIEPQSVELFFKDNALQNTVDYLDKLNQSLKDE